MKRFPLTAVAVALLFFVSACAANPNPQAGGPTGGQAPATKPSGGNVTYDVNKAQTLFKNNCSSCHGQNLEGLVGPNLTKVGSKYTKDQILQILAKGKGQMPPGLVSGSDADTLASWLADHK